MRILITGTSRGLGNSLAKQYLEKGDEVIGFSTSFSENLFIGNMNYIHFAVDMMDGKALDKTLQKLLSSQQIPDMVILNAGAAFDDHVETFDLNAFQKNFSLNLEGNMRILSFFLPIFRERGKGTFAVLSSLSVHREVRKERIGYSASKNALDVSIQNLARHYRQSGIRFAVFRAGSMAEEGGLLRASYDAAATRIISRLGNPSSESFIDEFPFLSALATRVVALLPESLFIKLMK